MGIVEILSGVELQGPQVAYSYMALKLNKKKRKTDLSSWSLSFGAFWGTSESPLQNQG